MRILRSAFSALLVGAILISCDSSDSSDSDNTFSLDQQSQGIFRMDLSTANISEQFGYQNYTLMSDSELRTYFNRMKSMNFRKLDDNHLLIDNYNFSKKVELTRSGDASSFIVIYSPNDTSGLQIILQGTISGGQISASYSVVDLFYTEGQEWQLNADYTFSARLKWLPSNQWEPATPAINELYDAGTGRGIRLYFSPSQDDFVKAKGFRVYRINDITSQLNYIKLADITSDGSRSYQYTDNSSWAMNAKYLDTPGYLVTAIGENGIESFLSQEAFKAMVLKR